MTTTPIIPEIPRTWLQLLRVMELHFPEVLLAGGAVRDLILGKRPKDLDLWVNPHTADAEFLKANLRAFPRDPANSALISQPSAAHQIESIWTCNWKGTAVEIIVLNAPLIADPEALTSTFDIGLCQAAMYPSGMVYLSEHFTKDLRDHTMTVIRDETPHSTLARLERFKAKFPDFTIDDSLIVYHGDDPFGLDDEIKTPKDRLSADLDTLF
jgi:hypothetical protein